MVCQICHTYCGQVKITDEKTVPSMNTNLAIVSYAT